MNLKKVSLLLVLFSGILGCECFNAGSEWNIASFEVEISDLNGPPVNGVVTGDSISMFLTFEATFAGTLSNPFNGMFTSLYALSCESPGDDGLDDKIASFAVTSSSGFNDVLPGESLNELLRVYETVLVDDWIARSDSWELDQSNWVDFTFIERPEAGSIHRFTLRFTLESGTIVEQTTEEVRWD